MIRVEVRVGQVLKETSWLKIPDEKGPGIPSVNYTRVDAIVRTGRSSVDICGPGATTPEGTALYAQIFGRISPGGGATVEKTVTDEWGGKTVRKVIPLNKLPGGLIWSDETRADYAGLGPTG